MTLPHNDSFLERIEKASTVEELIQIKSSFLGKNGGLAHSLKLLGTLSLEERKTEGPRLNALKDTILKAISKKQKEIENEGFEKKLRQEALDVTLPGPTQVMGQFHPLMHALSEIIEIFSSMGFSVRRGPDIETSFYNFDALNVPPEHPARAEQDTFYLHKGYLLRTQTSPVQIRSLMSEPLPLRMISPGRVYRSDHDKTHTPMFHQVEGLVVEPHIHMGHLKGCVESFLAHFFGPSITVRFRPSYFPFTEPSAEIDIAYHKTRGEQKTDWLEVMGCGMVHPNVFKACGLSQQSPQGFAFGMGVERMAMIKYGITDIRCLFQNDQRWLSAYGTTCAYAGLS